MNGCRDCATCKHGFTKPSTWMSGDKCSDCGHVRCPKAVAT